MSERLPSDGQPAPAGAVDTRYTRFSSPPKMKPTKARPSSPTFPKVRRAPMATPRSKSVFYRQSNRGRGEGNATYDHGRGEAKVKTGVEPGAAGGEAENENVYEPPISGTYGSTDPTQVHVALMKAGDQADDEPVYAGDDDYQYHQADAAGDWAIVQKDPDGTTRFSRAKFNQLKSTDRHYQEPVTGKQMLAKKCIFYFCVTLYTVLMVVRLGLFLASVVLGGECLLKLDSTDTECILYDSSTSSKPTTSQPHATTTSQPPTTLPQNESTNASTPLISPTFSSVHTIWLTFSVINSILILIYTLWNAQKMKLPQHRLLVNRLVVCKYFWTQLVLLTFSLLYEARFLYFEFKGGESAWPKSENVFRGWTVAGWLMSIFDKILALVVVCYINYAKPFGVARTRRYLQWITIMYMVTLVCYTLDQAFSVLFEGLRAALQAVTHTKGASVRFGPTDSQRDQALGFLLQIFSLFYHLRLLEFFSDKIFYRNKDVFELPRNTLVA